MAKQLAVDPKRCVACRSCELWCSFRHNEVFNPRLSRVSVFNFEASAVTVPVMCLQCDESACVKVCPTGALERRADGVVVHDDDKCIVCKMCVNACPLGNISYSPITKSVFKCDLCEGDPWCVKYCPTGAITLVDPDEVPDKKLAVAVSFKETMEEA
jgi:Fe-S-cluster-containing hydrogenase component 2